VYWTAHMIWSNRHITKLFRNKHCFTGGGGWVAMEQPAMYLYIRELYQVVVGTYNTKSPFRVLHYSLKFFYGYNQSIHILNSCKYLSIIWVVADWRLPGHGFSKHNILNRLWRPSVLLTRFSTFAAKPK